LMYSERAEQINPDIRQIQNLLGDIYQEQKNYDLAIRSYKRCLEIDSDDPQIMTSLAVAYLRTGRNMPARELLTSVVQIQPDNNTAYQYLGYCYLRLENVDKATESYNRAIEINHKDWQAYRGLGVAYMWRALHTEDQSLKVELKGKAIHQWRLSLDINPNQPRRERLLELIEKYSG